ncbi:MAG TPA: class I SAM-dependent methyltransferase [Saprospiraceae bacterium]|jgi:SAM-dependent methyltransferase|nr:class I SAM-dependent methyltransferase [Saprospiraceae bacterium]HMT71893.1 class I SAM-dependent methyltransferase [Saprospiraceae bacterium]
MSETKYHPEKYWSEVANLITHREEANVIAGDDEPYYRYKRTKFLRMLRKVDITDKSVLEVGCGPGGNLIELNQRRPRKLVGADISNDMVHLAKKNVPKSIDIVKTNGTELPFENTVFDIVITATVLQHNTDEKMLHELIQEICRVSSKNIVIFERIEVGVKGDDLCLGRPIDYYSKIFEKFGFKLLESEFINIRVSYYVCGIIRKVFNSKDRKEGEPLNLFSVYLQKLTLFFTRPLDVIFKSNKDLARLIYERV